MEGITLIGMPGSGKSVIGKQLAHHLGWDFVDLDILIKEKEGKSHAEIMKEKGEHELLQLEELYTLGLDFNLPTGGLVFSPGGSIIYSRRAMEKLKSETKIIYLDLPYEEIKSRLGNNLENRGIIGLTLRGLGSLYQERTPIYQKFAHHIIPCIDQNEKEVVDKISNLLFV